MTDGYALAEYEKLK
ncbi:MAG: hypothetical protein SOZ81_10075 [Agathobacter sp.]|nr:hypothetical protein [Agathobacter sp.]